MELDLSHNAFGPICADSLREFLESAYSLEILKLENNGLGTGGVVSFFIIIIFFVLFFFLFH